MSLGTEWGGSTPRALLCFGFACWFLTVGHFGDFIANASSPRPLQALSVFTDADINRVRTFLSLVRQHHLGEVDKSIDTVATWSRQDDSRVVASVRCLLEDLAKAHGSERNSTPPNLRSCGRTIAPTEIDTILGYDGTVSPAEFRRRLLEHAAALFADGAIGMAAFVQPGDQALLGVSDGRGEGGVGASLTAWQLEWAFLDMLSAHDEDRPYAKQWLVATSAALQRDYRLGEALPNLEHAQHLFPDDFTVLLYLGAVHETLAGSKAQSALIATPLPIGASFAYRPEREELQSAKGLLRKAVAAQPKSAVAHLRFGHVLGALGEFPLAMDELGRARQLAPPSDPEFDFDAAMLLGNGALGLGQLSAAEAEFQKASGLYPQATSARLALSYTAQQAGDVTDATTPLIRLLSTGRKDVADPWPGYWILHVRDATEALTRLRHRVSSERF